MHQSVSINSSNSLQGQLLIAQPTANSTFFGQGVVLVCEHHAKGAWGMMLTKPSNYLSVGKVAREMGINYNGAEPVYIGGPVQEDSLHFLHTPDIIISDTFMVTNYVCVTSSPSILHEIAEGRGPQHWRMFIGVSAWTGGQLEGEMSGKPPWTPQHRWLTQPCPRNIFDLPATHLWKNQTHNAIQSSVKNFFSD